MSGQSLNTTVDTLATSAAPSKEGVEAALGTSLKQTKDNPYWTFYEFRLDSDDVTGGEFRKGKDGKSALLILNPVDSLTEDDLALAQRGTVKSIDINPRIPPEGTDTQIYDVNGVRVSFQFTHNSRRLRGLALEWAAK
jgi:hypothetical protein